MENFLCDRFADALVTQVVCQAGQDGKIGRTALQKILYFLQAKGVPVGYKFDIQHYGPYSQDLYFRMDDLVADEFVLDVSEQRHRSEYQKGPKAEDLLKENEASLLTYQRDVSDVLTLFKGIPSEKMGLLATVHYIQSSHASFYNIPPDEELVICKVAKIKKRFSSDEIQEAYEILERAGVFNWSGN